MYEQVKTYLWLKGIGIYVLVLIFRSRSNNACPWGQPSLRAGQPPGWLGQGQVHRTGQQEGHSEIHRAGYDLWIPTLLQWDQRSGYKQVGTKRKVTKYSKMVCHLYHFVICILKNVSYTDHHQQSSKMPLHPSLHLMLTPRWMGTEKSTILRPMF